MSETLQQYVSVVLADSEGRRLEPKNMKPGQEFSLSVEVGAEDGQSMPTELCGPISVAIIAIGGVRLEKPSRDMLVRPQGGLATFCGVVAEVVKDPSFLISVEQNGRRRIQLALR